ncbi:MAG: lysophospholipase [Myxococcota bacterium]|jgi:alpha-beta hydrolase superfamily lysophospholipase|nr:lysophospholipase [Myxococcota bacterium]
MKFTQFLVVAVAAMLLPVLGCESPDIQPGAASDDSAERASSSTSRKIDWVYGRRVIDESFTGPNNTAIRYKSYKYMGYAQASVIFLNGRTEFVEKYDPMFTSLYNQSWATSEEQTLSDLPVDFYAIDHEGQGRSGGLKSHIDDYDIFVENLHAVMNRVNDLKKHKKPIFLMAHSMGGLIATRFAQTYPELVDGLILGSPMFGLNPPAGVSIDQLKQLAGAYATPNPYGLGFANRCALSPQLPVPVLGGIAMCMNNAFCRSCFSNPTQAGCDQLGIDWSSFHAAWAFLSSNQSIGCQNARTPEYSCRFPGEGFNGTTSNYDYCYWTENNPLAGPSMTFGWLWQSFAAIDAMNTPTELDKIRDIPTLVLSSPIDPIVNASAHGNFCNSLSNCQLVKFTSNFQTGPVYFHELFAETNRAAVLETVSTFIADQLGWD